MKYFLYDWGGANEWLFHAINNVHGDLLDRLMLLGTALGDHGNFPIYLALVALMAISATGRGDRYDGATTKLWLGVLAVFSIAYVADAALLVWLKPLLDFPRPPLALPGGVIVVGTPEYHHSLPSGHSSFAMLVAASLWPVLGRVTKPLAVLFVAWVGLSRISQGAHFPADVVAGFISCLLVVLLVRFTVQRLGHYG